MKVEKKRKHTRTSGNKKTRKKKSKNSETSEYENQRRMATSSKKMPKSQDKDNSLIVLKSPTPVVKQNKRACSFCNSRKAGFP